jgi:hypothetical protein
MATISTCLLLLWAVLGVGTSSAIAVGGRHGEEGNGGGRPDVSNRLQDILDKAHTGPLYDYPTSFTQGIIPVSFSAGSRDRELPPLSGGFSRMFVNRV